MKFKQFICGVLLSVFATISYSYDNLVYCPAKTNYCITDMTIGWKSVPPGVLILWIYTESTPGKVQAKLSGYTITKNPLAKGFYEAYEYHSPTRLSERCSPLAYCKSEVIRRFEEDLEMGLVNLQ